jgi:hypothetical protein
MLIAHGSAWEQYTFIQNKISRLVINAHNRVRRPCKRRDTPRLNGGFRLDVLGTPCSRAAAASSAARSRAFSRFRAASMGCSRATSDGAGPAASCRGLLECSAASWSGSCRVRRVSSCRAVWSVYPVRMSSAVSTRCSVSRLRRPALMARWSVLRATRQARAASEMVSLARGSPLHRPVSCRHCF